MPQSALRNALNAHQEKSIFMKSNVYTQGMLFAFLVIATFSIQKLQAQQFLTKIDGWNAYVHLPAEYTDSASKSYPVIIFIPGTGETGTDPSKLLSYGPSKFVAAGHNMEFSVNGKVEKPIVISLQPVALWPNAALINRKLDSVFARYRCDMQRVNVTGLSMGGWTWANYVNNYSPTYTNRITSIVSLSALEPDNGIANMKYYPMAGGTAWFFEGNTDLRGNDRIRDTMNRYVPGSARYTLYSGGHCCWNTFYNPTWFENGESIYTWMLKQRKALILGPTSPEADAGRDSLLSNVVLNYTLKGFANDPNGLPINFNWTKISGPSAGTITNPAILQTGVSGLAAGFYEFELRVTNTLGLIAKDTLVINNGIIVLPVNLTHFSATAKDKNNVLVQWKTSSEINTDYFIVEKSKDGQSFSESSRYVAKGTNNLGAPYYFTDYLPENGINFYRLKMVDKDGQFAYGKVVSVIIKKDLSNSIAISSAYASNNQVQLKLSSLNVLQANVSIVDVNGKKIYNGNISLNKGINNFNRNIYLPRGVYYVNLLYGNENITKAFIRE